MGFDSIEEILLEAERLGIREAVLKRVSKMETKRHSDLREEYDKASPDEFSEVEGKSPEDTEPEPPEEEHLPDIPPIDEEPEFKDEKQVESIEGDEETEKPKKEQKDQEEKKKEDKQGDEVLDIF